MFPVQFIILLLLASIPGQMRLMGESLPGTQLPIPLWQSITSFFATQFLLVIFVLLRTRPALREFHASSSSTTEITHRTDQLFSGARWAAVALTAIHLFCMPLSSQVLHWYEQTRILRHLPIVPETLFVLPALITWLGTWAALYHIEEAAHERSLPYRLARHAPVHAMPSLGAFLAMQSRHGFFPYLLILVSGLFERCGDYFSRWYPAAPEVFSAVGAVALVAVLPFLLVRVWATTPLTGPLRARLDAVAARYRLRFRNILLWRTHHLVINAAILGWVPYGRYFLMSDSLLETFSDQQLEAVFAHEVGHGVRRHIPWYVGILMAAMAFSAGLGTLATHIHLPWMSSETIGFIASGAALLLVAGAGFYFVAPRFEHQADWFAARHMGRAIQENPILKKAVREQAPVTEELPAALAESLGPVPGSAEAASREEYIAGRYPHAAVAGPIAEGQHAAAADPVAAQVAAMPPQTLRQTPLQSGAEIFISALDELAETAHRERDRRGIMHPSPNDRIKLLRKLALDSAAEDRFERSIRHTKWTIAGLLLTGIATVGVAMAIPQPLPAGTTQPATSTQASTATAPATATKPAAQTAPATTTSMPASQTSPASQTAPVTRE